LKLVQIELHGDRNFSPSHPSLQKILPIADVNTCLTIGAGGRHNMPPPRASDDSGLWNINCWRRDKLCGDLNSQLKLPCDLDLWSFDLESGVRVTCDVGYLCANFSLPRPLCSWFRPDVRDRQTSDIQTSDAHHRLMPPTLGAGSQ